MNRRSRRAVHPEHDDSPAHRGGLDSGTEDAANGVDHDVGATGQDLGAPDREFVRREGEVRRNGSCDCGPDRVRLDHDHRPGARGFEHRREQTPDRAGADDDHGLSWSGGRPIGPVDHARQWLHESRHLEWDVL